MSTVIEPIDAKGAPLVLRDGDVYRWRYTAAAIARRRAHVTSGTLYWCEDRQAIVRNGKLCDTYWAGYQLAPCGEEHVKNPADVELEFVCNLNDVRRIEPHAAKDYDAADVFDLRYQHGCYLHYVVKKDATPSIEAKLTWIRQKQADIKREIEARVRHLESLAKQEVRLEAGDANVSIG